MPKPRSLRNRFYRNIAIALAVPLMLMSGLTVYTAYRGARLNAVTNSNRLTELLSESIRRDISDSEMHLRTLAQLLSKHAFHPAHIYSIIEQNRLSHRDFLDIRVVDNNDIVIATTPMNRNILGSDMSGYPELTIAAATGRILWSRAFISSSVGKPVASIVAPYKNGVIMASYDFVKLRRNVTSLTPDTGVTISVLDYSGTVLAHTNPAKALRREWDDHSQTFMELAQSQAGQQLMTLNNRELLVTAATIANTDWVLVVTQDLQTIIGPVLRLASIYAACSVAFIVLGVVLAIRFSGRVFSYFQMLIGNIEQVALGKYELDLPDQRFLELREVAESFFAMSEEIRVREEHIEVLNEELQVRLHEAESANRAKSAFLANMSHELRTPLNGAMGMLQLLLSCELSEEQRSYAETSINSCRNLSILLNDILDLSRIEAGRMEILSEPFRLSELHASVMDIFQLPLGEKGVALSMDIDERIPDLQMGDPVRIKQVLFNLVGNAVKFTERGSISIEAYPLPIVKKNTYRILFSVADTGIGIPEEKLQSIFEPFTQVEGSYQRNHRGAGLGLSIVKRLVNLMEGNVAIDSTETVGTTIFFCLTLGLPPNEMNSEEQPREIVKACLLPALRMLVAEDERVNRQMVKALLKRQGIEPVCVENGKQAIEALDQETFDVVLMDVQMPVMDGVAAVRHIRASDASYRDIPIVAVTAYAMAGDRDVFMKAGFSDYLSKPINFDDLMAVVARNCNNVD